MTTIRWTNPHGGLWSTPADWTGGRIPGLADDTIIAGSGMGTISFFHQAASRTLLLDAPNGTIVGHATFHLGVEMEIQAGHVRLAPGGTIAGGLIADLDSGLQSLGGTLSGVSYQGTLKLSQPNASLIIQNGIHLAGTGGTGRATILLTGPGSGLAYAGTGTLDNATLDIAVGPPGPTPSGLSVLNPVPGPVTLTLSTQFSVVETGAFAFLHAGADPGDTLVNRGTITDAHNGGAFTIDGAYVTNAGTITVSNGGSLVLGSTILINTGHLSAAPGGAGQGATRLSFHGAVTNTGTILAAAGTTTFSENVTGAGHLLIGAAGTLDVLAGAVAGQTIDFLATTGQLTIANPSVFHGSIAHWGASDRIDLANVVSNGAIFANNTLTILEAGQSVAALHFAGAYTQSDFMVTTDNVGGTAITFT